MLHVASPFNYGTYSVHTTNFPNSIMTKSYLRFGIDSTRISRIWWCHCNTLHEVISCFARTAGQWPFICHVKLYLWNSLLWVGTCTSRRWWYPRWWRDLGCYLHWPGHHTNEGARQFVEVLNISKSYQIIYFIASPQSSPKHWCLITLETSVLALTIPFVQANAGTKRSGTRNWMSRDQTLQRPWPMSYGQTP